MIFDENPGFRAPAGEAAFSGGAACKFLLIPRAGLPKRARTGRRRETLWLFADRC
jgi:hypothetical protein